MKELLTFTILTICSICYGQSDSESRHRILNEIIKDRYSDWEVDIDPKPCNNRLRIDYGWIQQNFDIINKKLNRNEIQSLLILLDSSKCFSEVTQIDNTLELCDSSKIELHRLVRKFKLNKNSFTWDESQVRKSKGKAGKIIAVSEPVTNDNKSILIVHIIFATKSWVRGETILMKKVDSTWTMICTLDSWVT